MNMLNRERDADGKGGGGGCWDFGIVSILSQSERSSEAPTGKKTVWSSNDKPEGATGGGGAGGGRLT